MTLAEQLAPYILPGETVDDGIRRLWKSTIPADLRRRKVQDPHPNDILRNLAAERRAKLAPDVLRLKAEGKTNMLIAVNLGISDTTVRRILKEAQQ